MKTQLKKILWRVGILSAVLSLAVVAYSVRGNEAGTTFATHGIDLKIDSKAYYNGVAVPSLTWALKDLIPTADRFFKFKDIKPGDSGKTVISMHVQKSDAFLCLDFKNLKNLDNGLNEPEAPVDPNGTLTGELAQGTKFFAWIDDGDNKYEPGEKLVFGNTPQPASSVLNSKSYTVGDSQSGGSCRVNQVRYVGLAWCAGNFTVNLANGAFACNGATLGNAAQTDSFTFDVAIRAVTSQDNPHFKCNP